VLRGGGLFDFRFIIFQPIKPQWTVTCRGFKRLKTLIRSKH
jgi:hypothetical protein